MNLKPKFCQKTTAVFCVSFLLVLLLLVSCKQKTYWTYRDNETGLEINFPEGWSKLTNYPDTDATLAKRGLRKIEFSNNKDWNTDQRSYLILVVGKTWEKPPHSQFVKIKKQQVVINGVEEEKQVFTTKSDNKIVHIRTYLKRKDTYFTILFSTQTREDWELFDNIISTLRFK